MHIRHCNVHSRHYKLLEKRRNISIADDYYLIGIETFPILGFKPIRNGMTSELHRCRIYVTKTGQLGLNLVPQLL